MAKHYIKINENNLIVKGFSTEFEEPQDSDICISETGGRHFELLGEVNPNLVTIKGVYLYKYENGKAIRRTDEEIKRDKNTIIEGNNPQELLAKQITSLLLENKKKDLVIDEFSKKLEELTLKISNIGGKQ